ncbi:MAG: transposase [Flavobacteriaceae bacterium]|nr:transposase [Flavobacteriaceae bacterium]
MNLLTSLLELEDFKLRKNVIINCQVFQRFIANYVLCSDWVAKLIFSLLPKRENLTLSIDRTNWKFGTTDINIFMLGVVYDGVAFPLMFKMLNKRGNSNSQERIDLIERFNRLFSVEKIDVILADREFVGREWIAYLNLHKIRYFIRIRNNFKVKLANKEKQITVWHLLFNRYRVNEFVYLSKSVLIKGEYYYLSGCKTKDCNGKKEFLILISYNKPENSIEYWKQR